MVFDTGKIGLGFKGVEVESPDGLRGTVGFVGDPGRLENVLEGIGVTGVLEGLSIGIVKLRNAVDADDSPLRISLTSDPTPVGTDGRENLGFSSNSSIEGNA